MESALILMGDNAMLAVCVASFLSGQLYNTLGGFLIHLKAVCFCIGNFQLIELLSSSELDLSGALY